jgi:hypothetical protein
MQIWTCQDGVWQLGLGLCLPGPFDCGDQECQTVDDYCEITTGASGQPSYACKTLPQACHGHRCPQCDCLSGAGIPFAVCKTDTVGGIWAFQ